jgi:hypothetical protein
MAEVEKSPFENLITGPSGWPEAYHQLQQLTGARGAILFILIAAALLILWKWEAIVKPPGIKWLIERLKRRRIPEAPAGRFTIAVAHLARDNERLEHERVLLDELQDKRKFEGVEVIRVDRTVDPEEGDKKKPRRERGTCLRKPAPTF